MDPPSRIQSDLQLGNEEHQRKGYYPQGEEGWPSVEGSEASNRCIVARTVCVRMPLL